MKSKSSKNNIEIKYKHGDIVLRFYFFSIKNILLQRDKYNTKTSIRIVYKYFIIFAKYMYTYMYNVRLIQLVIHVRFIALLN